MFRQLIYLETLFYFFAFVGQRVVSKDSDVNERRQVVSDPEILCIFYISFM